MLFTTKPVCSAPPLQNEYKGNTDWCSLIFFCTVQKYRVKTEWIDMQKKATQHLNVNLEFERQRYEWSYNVSNSSVQPYMK